MWAEFEWENKVAVNTSITEVKEFLAHVVSITNMRCLTPQTALQGDSPFIAANLYARRCAHRVSRACATRRTPPLPRGAT